MRCIWDENYCFGHLWKMWTSIYSHAPHWWAETCPLAEWLWQAWGRKVKLWAKNTTYHRCIEITNTKSSRQKLKLTTLNWILTKIQRIKFWHLDNQIWPGKKKWDQLEIMDIADNTQWQETDEIRYRLKMTEEN